MKKRRKKQPVVRRIPDESGKLVTYLCTTELQRLLGISETTIHKWIKAGAVRTPGILAGERHASVLDATLLCTLPPRTTFALGIRRVPEADLRRTHEYFEGYQGNTAEVGKMREVWDDYDIAYVAHRFQQGMPIEEIAKNVERTYSAVLNMIQRLRKNGDLPALDRTRTIEDAALLLTAPERGMLLAAA